VSLIAVAVGLQLLNVPARKTEPGVPDGLKLKVTDTVPFSTLSIAKTGKLTAAEKTIKDINTKISAERIPFSLIPETNFISYASLFNRSQPNKYNYSTLDYTLTPEIPTQFIHMS